MQKYIGTKQVEAEPMTMGAAYEAGLLRGEPDEGCVNHMGYHVKYQDGYESWSPAEPFESSYMVAETPIDRLTIEIKDLNNRRVKLYNFIDSVEFQSLSTEMKALLSAQHKIMHDYAEVLCARRSAMLKELKGAHFSFSVAIALLHEGYACRRVGWNGKGLFVVKQVPAQIEKETIPNMQSLPQQAKNLILGSHGSIHYRNQCLIYNEYSGYADSWVPSVSDVFADDWEVVT